jgi:hypothetical protein
MTLLNRLTRLGALLALAALAACSPADGDAPLKILATDPGPEAILGQRQRFHVRFAVNSKTPLVVTVDPYFQREPLSLNLGTSAPVTLPAGGGTAVAHVFFWGEHATRVDEIRLVARAPKQQAVVAEVALPVKLSWVAREVPPHEAAPWVAQAQKNTGSTLDGLDERSQWLAFGAVIIAIALGGFGSRWLRKRWRARNTEV